MKDIFSIDNRGVNSEEENIFEELETNYHANFKKIILDNSLNNNNYSKAIKEWVFYGEVFEEVSYCICGHSIRDNCVIHNILNERTLITGNCCIKKVGMIRKHANKSRKNYLEMAKMNAKTLENQILLKDCLKHLKQQEKLNSILKKSCRLLKE